MTTATTKDITIYRTSIDIDCCGHFTRSKRNLIKIILIPISSLRAIHRSKGTTTIDTTLHCTFIRVCDSSNIIIYNNFLSDIHLYLANDSCNLAFTTTKHITVVGINRTDSNLAGTDVHRGINTHISSITATIDITVYFHLCRSITTCQHQHKQCGKESQRLS